MAVLPPKPEADYKSYNKTRVQISYEYTMARLTAQRKPTPRTHLALILHQQKCRDALENGLTEERQKMIQEAEKDIGNAGWVGAVLPPQAHALMDQLVDLRWQSVLATVGDFVRLPCTDLRRKARGLSSDNAHLMGLSAS